MLPKGEELINGECLYCGKGGQLDPRGACKECILDAYRREEFFADRSAGDFDDPREEE